ncbi:MAG TPA: peptidylprolyl isomerase [Acidobacteriaceae bacterium]|jgi:peptidyl-prolyl cis-trans isomerase A (cyclophilin A)|nr:peptidylprolyl isomerase [Acidobacteriaceae bacterium]
MISLRRTSFLAAAVLLSFGMGAPVFAQQPGSTVPDAPVPQTQPSTPPSTPQSAPAEQQAVPGSAQPLPDAPDMNARPAPQPTGATVLFDTSMGRMTCKLFDKQAPVAVANFVGLATGTKEWTDPATKQKVQGKPFYDGTTFHRVIPEFMIQGGDRLGTGEGDAGYYFNDEFDPALNFDVPGRLAMANSGPNTNGTQFFITEAPYPSLDQHYVIFGQCDDHSVLVVQSIARVNRDDQDKPIDPVMLNKVTVIPVGQPVPAASTAAAAPATPQNP